MMFSQMLISYRIFKRQAKALIWLSIYAGWSKALLVAHTTLLEISCTGSNDLAALLSHPLDKKIFVRKNVWPSKQTLWTQIRLRLREQSRSGSILFAIYHSYQSKWADERAENIWQFSCLWVVGVRSLQLKPSERWPYIIYSMQDEICFTRVGVTRAF